MPTTYIRVGHPSYHWDASRNLWMRTHLYGFVPPVVVSLTLFRYDEARGAAWLLANGWTVEAR